MDIYRWLVLVHVVCFAIWFGSVVVSWLLIRALEERLTDAQRAEPFAALLRHYIRLETRVVDVAFVGVVVTGVAMAQFFVGWSPWVVGKLVLYLVQFGVTLWYLLVHLRPLCYPCTAREYRRWYELLTLSFVVFGLSLVWTYFGRGWFGVEQLVDLARP